MPQFAQQQAQHQQSADTSPNIAARPRTPAIQGPQPTIGNQAALRRLRANSRSTTLMRSPASGTQTTSSTVATAPASLSDSPAKITVNSPGDVYEQQADRISQQIMSAPDPLLQRSCACGGSCDDCQKKKSLQMKSLGAPSSQHAEAPPTVHQVLRSSGQPLDPSTRAFMEPRFGTDFSHVRIHSDSAARQSAQDVQARAYTVGKDIVFAPNQFSPQSQSGRTLLAHELTHVVQQNGGRSQAMLQRAPWGTCPEGPRVSAMRRPDIYVSAELFAVGEFGVQFEGDCLLYNKMIAANDWPKCGGEEGETIKKIQNSFHQGHKIKRRPVASPHNVTERPESEAIVGAVEEFAALLQPDMLNITKKEVFDVTTKGQASRKKNTISHYVRVLNAIAGPGWKAGTSMAPIEPLTHRAWPRKIQICYGPTDFSSYAGVIQYEAYDPDESKKKKKSKKKEDEEESKKKKNKSKSDEEEKDEKKKKKKTDDDDEKAEDKTKGGNVGFGIGILSSGGGKGNATVGISINSHGHSYGTVSAGIVYDSNGNAVGAATAGVGVRTGGNIAGAANAGAAKDSSGDSVATAGAGTASGTSSESAVSAAAGRSKDSDTINAASAAHGDSEGQSGVVAGQKGAAAPADQTATPGGEAGSSPSQPSQGTPGQAQGQGPATPGQQGGQDGGLNIPGLSPAETKQAVDDATRIDAMMRNASQAQKDLMQDLAQLSPDERYIVPSAEWARRLLVATNGLTDAQVQQLRKMNWRPGNVSPEELRKKIDVALKEPHTAPAAESAPDDLHKDVAGAEQPFKGTGPEAKDGKPETMQEAIARLQKQAKDFDWSGLRLGYSEIVWGNEKVYDVPISAKIYTRVKGKNRTEVHATADVSGTLKHVGKIDQFHLTGATPMVTSDGQAVPTDGLIGQVYNFPH